MNKDEIRKRILKIRDSLSPSLVLLKSKKIKEILFELKEFKCAENILFYYSFRSEVRTDIMIKDCKKRVFLPKVKGKELEILEIKSLNDLKPGYCGILEPTSENPVSPDEIDLVIVPGVCFDKRGFRIGYGSGYYDRLLPLLNCKKIGIAFSLQIVDKIPNTINDIRVDKIITEDGPIIPKHLTLQKMIKNVLLNFS